MVMADPPDALDSGSYNLTSTRTYTRAVPKQVLGFAMIAITALLGLGVFSIIRGPLRNVPVVGSLMSAGSNQDQLPQVNKVAG